MNKNQIRKEIAALIDSIKDHSDNIGDKQHITQLELELILSKVKKLYEKSIVYNYLNSLPAPHTLHTLDSITNDMLSKSSGTIGQHRSDTMTTIDLATPSTLSFSSDADIAPDSSAADKNTGKGNVSASQKKYPELKSFIGINQKFQFIKLLFHNDIAAFDAALTKIDATQSLAEANDYLKALVISLNWDTELEIYLTFQHITEKKFQ